MKYKVIGNKQFRLDGNIYFPGQEFICNDYLSDDLIKGRVILVNDHDQPSVKPVVVSYSVKKKKQKEVDING